MLAYLFWHAPLADVEPGDYETALLVFQADLARTPPSGFASCAAYRISKIPWLNNRKGYEDWYFVQSSADLDPLNEAAIQPARWDVHARVASKMQFGQGGLYAHLYGAEQPREGTRGEPRWPAWRRQSRRLQSPGRFQALICVVLSGVGCDTLRW